jgi:hypothetical protein
MKLHIVCPLSELKYCRAGWSPAETQSLENVDNDVEQVSIPQEADESFTRDVQEDSPIIDVSPTAEMQ